MADIYRTLSLPFKDKLADSAGLLSTTWQWFFRTIWDRVYPLGLEQTFPLVNNQGSVADITGLKFNFESVSQAVVDFLIQRVTTSTGATELIESGEFIVNYRPSSGTWDINFSNIIGYIFTVTAANATAGAVYTNNGNTFIVSNTIASGTTLYTTANGAPSASGTLTKSSGTGDATITFSSSSVRVCRYPNNSGISFTITSSGQVQYTSSNITGTASISRIVWRARSLNGKHSSYSLIGKR